MRNFIFLIGSFLFLTTVAEAQVGRCGCYFYPYYGGVPSVVYEPVLNYEIVNIVEHERFYVTAKAWDRTYTIPVINGYLPELTAKNANPYDLLLDYGSRVRYSRERHGTVVVYTVDGDSNTPPLVNNKYPMAPKNDSIKNKAKSSNTPKRPDTKDLDELLGLPAPVRNFAEDSEVPKRPSVDDLNNLIQN